MCAMASSHSKIAFLGQDFPGRLSDRPDQLALLRLTVLDELLKVGRLRHLGANLMDQFLSTVGLGVLGSPHRTITSCR